MFNDQEKSIVRRFGTKAVYIKYSRSDMLLGFRILGLQSGFEVESDDKLRWARILSIGPNNQVIRTNRKLPLRFDQSLHDLVPGLWKFVR